MRSLAMQSLTRDIETRHPGVVIWGIGDDAHKLRASDHNEDDTAGSRSAQSDTDSIPEHRAIDVKIGPALSDAQMLVIINEILADPADLARLIYINFKNWQWSASTGWTRQDNSDDPHPTHAHFSGKASQDGNAAPWLKTTQGGSDMIPIAFGEGEKPALPSSRVQAMQLALVRAGGNLTPFGGADGRYGNGTATVMIQVLGPIAGDGKFYDAPQYDALQPLAYGRGPKGDPGTPGAPGAPGAPGGTPTEVTFGPIVAQVSAVSVPPVDVP